MAWTQSRDWLGVKLLFLSVLFAVAWAASWASPFARRFVGQGWSEGLWGVLETGRGVCWRMDEDVEAAAVMDGRTRHCWGWGC